ncbi:aminoacyl-histidine dipeptidase [Clostridium sp. MSJ-4]|uniref:Aminoacyl-histidine dipeptidase n=1 Tax=Clostridium simiarum TaxID=2841506 RepID=A0ABS6EYD6_9CLOT|nr:aminoacyl-histidine dipeptidase [Clostridium simiarum]MBU5590408.1 aminoacyl-histidine dipeptidase [Clostridium simiarum]
MNYILKDLEPKSVLKYFEDISRIPRGSGNEKEISDFLVNFAKDRNLKVIQDKALNVIIKKCGTKGYEKAPTVIIQGHMDMVCEKNIGTNHDFTKDPLKLRIKDDYLYATDTTLGADNGIAVAYALALLDSKDIPHPPLEVLITTEEETGMGGAFNLEAENIKGRILINIDSEEEGKLLVSCAGGLRNKIILPICWEEENENRDFYVIRIRGLKGGHSGMEIDKGRANSNKLMGRILVDILKHIDFRLVSLTGGSKNNAIPREMDAKIAIKAKDYEKLKSLTEKINEVFKNEYKVSDPEVKIIVENIEGNNKIFSKESTEKAVKLLYMIPNGIQSMSMEIKDLVQSSTNLGVVSTTEKGVVFDSAVRSSIGSLKEDILTQSQIISELLGATIETTSSYPEWQYDADSNIRKIFQKVYKDLYGKDAEVIAIHAGVECGLFKEKFGEIDMISFGPNIYDVHTPDEHASISSMKNMWEYLVAVLKEIK